jgi:glycosyltransferase involved in cell wall biosynthesis
MGALLSTSFVIPHYNDVETIGRTITHLLKASAGTACIMVIDDGSCLEIAQELDVVLKKYPSVELCRRKENRGIGSTLLEGLSSIKTPLAGFASANDYYLNTDYFRVAEKKLIRESVAFCFAKAKLIDSVDGSEKGIVGWAPKKNSIICPEEFRRFVFESKVNVPGATVIGRTSMFRAVPFDLDQGPQMDTFCHLTMGMLAGAYYHHKVVAVCSVDPKSLTNNQDQGAWIQSHVSICRRWQQLALLPTESGALSTWLQFQSKSYLEDTGESGDPQKVAQEIMRESGI